MTSTRVHQSLSWVGIPICLFSLVLVSACDYRPRLEIEGDTVPLFKLTGVGNIQVISVDGPDFENSNGREAGSRNMKPYWQIAPKVDYDLARIEKLGGLLYARVPDGFRQVFPENGAAPQPLLQDELFTFSLRVAEGNGIGVRFVIHNGKAVIEGS